MKILFLSRTQWSESIGGVERHVKLLKEEFESQGHKITIVTQKDLAPPKLKLWFKLITKLKWLNSFDLIWVHDVFFWILPIVYLIKVPIVTTLHGWEGDYSPKVSAIVQKKLAQYFSKHIVLIGSYIGDWYHLNKTQGSRLD